MGLDVSFEAPQRIAPERVVVLEPIVHGAQRPGVQRTESGRAVLARHDQARRAQEAKVLGDGGPARRKVGGDLTDGLLPTPQQPEDLAACRIGESAEHHVPLSSVDGNHSVTIIVTMWLPSIKSVNRRGWPIGDHFALTGLAPLSSAPC